MLLKHVASGHFYQIPIHRGRRCFSESWKVNLSMDFVILDMEEDFDCPLLLGQLFSSNGKSHAQHGVGWAYVKIWDWTCLLQCLWIYKVQQ